MGIEGDGSSGGTGSGSEDAKGASQDSENKKPVEEGGSDLDEYGYKKVKKEEEDAGKKEEVSKDPDKKSLTGYESDEGKKEEPPKKTEEDSKKKEDAPKDFELENTGDLFPEEVENIKAFVKKHSVSKELAQALVENKKEEVKRYQELVTDQDAKLVADREQVRRDWKTELKTDSDFGGEKFTHNIRQVDKIVDEFFPGIKKVLTEGKTMLPPYLMRDLAKFADHLYSPERLTQGDPITPKQSEEENKDKSNDPLDFYNSKEK